MAKKLWGFWEAVEVFPWTLESNPYADWLYGDDWNKHKLHQFMLSEAIYPLHLYNDYLLDLRKSEEYLRRNNMTYLDIHDPRNLYVTGSGSAGIRYGINFISSNIGKLYR